MTDLFKAYARQVASYHPAKARDELYLEVYDELCEEYGDWKESHPDRDEANFLDERREHPMKLATRMAGEHTACLVGPSLYYSFISTLKTVAVIVVIVHIVLAVVRIFAGQGVFQAAMGMLGGMPETLLWVGAAVLGVFVALERSGERAKWLDTWSASELEPGEDRHEISRVETSFDLGLSTLALLWVLDVIDLPVMVRHDGQWVDSWVLNVPDPVWWVAGAILAFEVVFALYRLSRTFWNVPTRLVTVAVNIGWLVLLGFVLTLPQLLSTTQPELDGLSDLLDHVLRGSIGVVMAIVAWDTVVHAWRTFRTRVDGS